jgi:hypothetical protein
MVDSIDRLVGARTTFGVKKPVAAATTANITLSGAQTIDGIAVVADDRVLVKDQSTTADNGIYIAASGEWTRAVDFDGTTDWCKGTLVVAAAGTINAGKIFRVTSADPADVGTSAITFESISFADAHANAAIVASATLNLNAADADMVGVTGSGATIATIILAEGLTRIIRFTEAGNVLVHSATLLLPGALNITTIANDYLIVRGFSLSIVHVVAYMRGDGHPLITGDTSIVVAATTDLGSVREQSLSLSGSTTITSFGSSAPAGAVKFCRVNGTPLIVHDGVNISCPGGRSIQAADGDTFIVRHSATLGGWRIYNYTRVAFQPHTDTTATSNATTAESDLLSYSLPAGRLASSGAGIRIKAWGTGTTVSTAVTRRLRLYFGATVIADTGNQNVPPLWGLQATLLRTTVAGTQEAFGEVLVSTGGAGTVLYQRSNPAETLSAAVTIKVTGLCTASTGVLTQTGFVVEQLSV